LISIGHITAAGVVTVMSGEIALSSDGHEQLYAAGDSFTELPGQALQAINRTLSEAVLVATFLLPDGATLTSKA